MAEDFADAVPRDERIFVESVHKAMRVLDAFRCDTPLTIADIAQLTGIGRSAAQRFIHTWNVMGYIRKADGGKGYVLTPKALMPANRFLNSHYVLERAHPYLVEAVRRSQERVGYGELDGTDYVLLYQAPSARAFDLHNPVGTRYRAYLATSGLAIMAFLPDEDVEAILARSDLVAVTDHTITDRAGIMALLADVRQKGYCITEQLSSHSRISVSVPVFRTRSKVVGAVNISTLLVRHSRQSVETELMPIAVETARAISSIFSDPANR